MLAESSSENISSSSWGNNNTIDLEDVAGVPSTTSSSNANVNQPHKKQREVYNRRKEKGKLNPNLGPISNNGNGTGGSGALALYLSSRRTMCIHERVVRESDHEAVDVACRSMAASWVQEQAESNAGLVEICEYHDHFQAAGEVTSLSSGIFDLDQFKTGG